jgi:hypothetical protein
VSPLEKSKQPTINLTSQTSRGPFHLHSTGKSGKNLIPFHELWIPESMAGNL